MYQNFCTTVLQLNFDGFEDLFESGLGLVQKQ